MTITGLTPEAAAWLAELEAIQAEARKPKPCAIVTASDTRSPHNELGHLPCLTCGVLQGMPHVATCPRRMVLKSWAQHEPESDSQNSYACPWCGNTREDCFCGDIDSMTVGY